MPKPLQFSPKEVVEVWNLKAECKPVLQISLCLNRSTRGVYSVLKHEKQFKNTYCAERSIKPHFVQMKN